ncbi:unnamed protein product, partial [Meganyctiphanes norvegica]
MSEISKFGNKTSILDTKNSQEKSQKHKNNCFIYNIDHEESDMDSSDEVSDAITEQTVNKDKPQAELYTNLLFPYANCLKEICDNTELDPNEHDENKSSTKLFDQLSRDQILYPYACLLRDLHNMVQQNTGQSVSKDKVANDKKGDYEVAEVMKDLHFQRSFVNMGDDNDMSNLHSNVDTSFSDSIKGIYMQHKETLYHREPQSLYNNFNGIGKILASEMPPPVYENPSCELQSSAFLQQISNVISEGKYPLNSYKHNEQINDLNFSNLSVEKFGDIIHRLPEQNPKNTHDTMNLSVEFPSEEDDYADEREEKGNQNQSPLNDLNIEHLNNESLKKSRSTIDDNSYRLSQMLHERYDNISSVDTLGVFTPEEASRQILKFATDDDHTRIAKRSSSSMASAPSIVNTGKNIYSRKRGKPQNSHKRKIKLELHTPKDIIIKEEDIKEESILEKDEHYICSSISKFMTTEILSGDFKRQGNSKENDNQYYMYENGSFNMEKNICSFKDGFQTSDGHHELQEVSVKSEKSLKEPNNIRVDRYKQDDRNSFSSVENVKLDKEPSFLLQEYLSKKDKESIIYKNDTVVSGSILQKYLQRNYLEREDTGNNKIGRDELQTCLEKEICLSQ